MQRCKLLENCRWWPGDEKNLCLLKIYLQGKCTCHCFTKDSQLRCFLRLRSLQTPMGNGWQACCRCVRVDGVVILNTAFCGTLALPLVFGVKCLWVAKWSYNPQTTQGKRNLRYIIHRQHILLHGRGKQSIKHSHNYVSPNENSFLC